MASPPSLSKTWNISACNRISYVSLPLTMGAYLRGVKDWTIANGYVLKGTSNGSVGSMDGVDRLTTASAAAVRGASSSNAQSWAVITDASGVDVLLTYQGGSDDIARVSFSPGGLFVLGTPSEAQPTASDECVVSTAASLIGATASGDRLWSVWVSSDAKMFRMAIARSGQWVGRLIGVEIFESLVEAPMTLTPPTWGFALTTASSAIVNGSTAGVARPVVAGTPVIADVRLGIETFANNPTLWGNVKPEAQGASGYPAVALAIGSFTTGAQGKFGNLIDVWQGRTAVLDGDTYASGLFIGVSGYSGPGAGLWPWTGVAPVMT